MKYSKIDFGKLSNGSTVYKYILENNNGMSVDVITFGATVTSIKFQSKEMVLGWDSMEEWENNPIFAGTTVGRIANRIGGAKFKIDDNIYELSKNEGNNLLHGGKIGFDKILWGAQVVGDENNITLILSTISPDGDQGFPGNLDVYVNYTLNNDNELRIDYNVTTDIKTHVNLSHHSYFNLSDEPTVENHDIMINADKYTPVDSESIPTGEIASVDGTPMDLREMKALEKRLKANNEEGFDHNFVINKSDALSLAAKVYAPDTGIEMEVLTTKPGIQFYTGNYIDNLKGRNGEVYQKHAGLCLEPQFYPDTPNHPNFPSSLLTPEDEYYHTIIYRFTKK